MDFKKIDNKTGPEGYEWLRPLQKSGDAYSDAVREKSHFPSENRKIAGKLRGLKLANPENLEKKALLLATNPKMSAIEITKLYSQLLEMDLSPKLLLILLGKICQAHSVIFGLRDVDTPVKNFDKLERPCRLSYEEVDLIKSELSKIRAENKELKDKLFILEIDNAK